MKKFHSTQYTYITSPRYNLVCFAVVFFELRLHLSLLQCYIFSFVVDARWEHVVKTMFCRKVMGPQSQVVLQQCDQDNFTIRQLVLVVSYKYIFVATGLEETQPLLSSSLKVMSVTLIFEQFLQPIRVTLFFRQFLQPIRLRSYTHNPQIVFVANSVCLHHFIKILNMRRDHLGGELL